jgi:hypothetical protein
MILNWQYIGDLKFQVWGSIQTWHLAWWFGRDPVLVDDGSVNTWSRHAFGPPCSWDCILKISTVLSGLSENVLLIMLQKRRKKKGIEAESKTTHTARTLFESVASRPLILYPTLSISMREEDWRAMLTCGLWPSSCVVHCSCVTVMSPCEEVSGSLRRTSDELDVE